MIIYPAEQFNDKIFRVPMSPPSLVGFLRTDKDRRLSCLWQTSTSGYYGLVSYVDSQIGRLLETLREISLDKNTVIVFTADHGTLLGEHGLFFKGVFYQPVTNVPLIFSAPGILPQGKVIKELVEMVDLAPTLLERAGIEVPSNMHGRSLLPLIRGEARGRDAVFSEIRNFFGSSGIRGARGSISRSVRTKGWLYISISEDGRHVDGALYDLIRDLKEINNLYGKPEYKETIQNFEALLEDWLRRTTR